MDPHKDLIVMIAAAFLALELIDGDGTHPL
jgi:hypothetical protein